MRLAGEATRERILAAAKAEFSERGLAGARINRIAAEANASKERLYAYFSSKDALFAAVTERLLVDVSEETVLAGDDLPAYVGRLFDSYVRNPGNARLHDWLSFSASDVPADSPHAVAMKAKLNDIRHAQKAGLIDGSWDPAQLLIMLIEIAKSMAYPNTVASHLLTGKAKSRTARRAAAVEAARRLTATSR
jgi:AcrR family transcriptional regulator